MTLREIYFLSEQLTTSEGFFTRKGRDRTSAKIVFDSVNCYVKSYLCCINNRHIYGEPIVYTNIKDMLLLHHRHG